MPAAQPVVPPDRLTNGRWLFVGSIATLVVLVAVLVIWRISLPRHGAPAEFETVGKTLVVKDGQGQELWRHEFPLMLARGLDPDSAARYGAFGDIDGDGETEVIFACKTQHINGRPETEVEDVYCFSQAGRVKWKFRPGKPLVVENSGRQFFPPYWINDVAIVPGRGRFGQRIVVSSNHHQEEPDQIAVLDGRGNMVGEYWHPGHLLYMGFADLNHDRKPKLLLGGINNAQHAATVVVFDPDHVAGTATGLLEDALGLKGLPHGTEKAVVLFPRTALALLPDNWQPYNRVCGLKITANRLHVVVTDGVQENDPKSLIYELDYNLSVRSISPLLGFEQAYAELERNRTVKQPLIPGGLKTIAAEVVVRRAAFERSAAKSETRPVKVP